MKRRGQGREGACRKPCCWTPLGVCARKGLCSCHKAGIEFESRVEQRRRQAALRHQDELRERTTWTL